jgi:hypothetical protein
MFSGSSLLVFGNIASISILLDLGDRLVKVCIRHRLVKVGSGDRLGIVDYLDLWDRLRKVIIKAVFRSFELSSQLSRVSNLLDILAGIELRVGESGLAGDFPF